MYLKKIVDDYDEKDNDDEILSVLFRIKGIFICLSEDVVDWWFKSFLVVWCKFFFILMIVGLDLLVVFFIYRYRRFDKMWRIGLRN